LAEGRETQPERSSNENDLLPTTDFVSRDNAYDAIARHEPNDTTEENYEKLDQDLGQNQSWVHSEAQKESEYASNINQCDGVEHEPTLPRRPRIMSSPPRPRAYSIHTYRVRANSYCGVIEEERGSGEEEERICEFHVDHGPSAIEEEEAALEFAAVLAAAKAASLGGGVGVAAAIGTGGRDWAALASTEEESICMEDEGEEEEEEDHCLSGLCMPQSHLFMTSVICSNTNARDGFGKRRTTPMLGAEREELVMKSTV
jgi:hypothetical protein